MFKEHQNVDLCVLKNYSQKSFQKEEPNMPKVAIHGNHYPKLKIKEWLIEFVSFISA